MTLNKDSPEYQKSKNKKNIILLFLTVFFSLIVLQTAWLCDDAYITYRTVDNFINGYGLRWNVIERVQTYTHPLWMFLISIIYFFTREIFFSSIFFSVAISVFAIWLLNFKIAQNTTNAILITLILVFSKAFVDYSTSGLENPLTHLILAVFFIYYFKFENSPAEKHTSKNLFILSLIASMGILNRMDTLLIFFPPLLYVLLKKPIKAPKIKAAILGFFPLIFWEIFSLFYYGFLFPNTAYTKLNTGIGSSKLIEQGFYYLLNSINWDPITLFTIMAILLYTFFSPSKNRFYTWFGVGILLYLIYIIRIGGDFMSGRFLTAPLFGSVILLARIRIQVLSEGIPIFILIFLLGLKVFNPSKTVKIDHRGVADERIYYANSSSLLKANRFNTMPKHKAVQQGKQARKKGGNIVRVGGMGYFGFFAGPDVHVLDNYAIGDPLLTKLPCRKPWRIGHFRRIIPKGYLKSIKGKNQIHDPSLAKYWDKLKIVTRGKLFSWNRLKEIWNFNIGKYNHLIKEYLSRMIPTISYSQSNKFKKEGTPIETKGNILFNKKGIEIQIPGAHINSPIFSISLNNNEKYWILYLRKGKEVSKQDIQMPASQQGGLSIWWGSFPPEAIQKKFDTIRIIPQSKKVKHGLGHFLVHNIFPTQIY